MSRERRITDEYGTPLILREEEPGIERVQALSWPDGYCTVGFRVELGPGRYAMAPSLAGARMRRERERQYWQAQRIEVER